MAKTGKNPSFTNQELYELGMIVSKVSARLGQLMATYPPKTFVNVVLKKFRSRRAILTVRLLVEFVSGPTAKSGVSNQTNLKNVLRELARNTVFDQTDIVSNWGNKGKRLSTKEETAILQSLVQRGVVKNIVGKRQISETAAVKLKEDGGYPSIYQLTPESKHIGQLLSKRESLDFILGSLAKSKLLFITYWYIISSLFYFLRDCEEHEISQLVAFGRKLIPNYQPPEYFSDPRLKSALASIDDQQLLGLTKSFTTEVINTPELNILNHLFLLVALLKINRFLD